ncbi:M14 family zinc carboxypeptidase [Catenovulum sediminis]|uniref:M14 family zinc carboxypeptidase n=1 Tax=Catenovulum sediminis TaxID=1740262 RepID=A0ABV1RJ40_9ALTE|nr:M14 family zinc carboxypeptidase [Catenovulum sediminis]
MSLKFVDNYLPELKQLEHLIELSNTQLRQQTLAHVNYNEHLFPIYALSLGSEKQNAPVITFVGGVHGLERIGTQVLLAFLESVIGRLAWDKSLNFLLENVRLNFVPLVNPVGMACHKRSNGNGVDLMRNAPVNSDEKTAFLVGGQRISPRIPWYRGKSGEPMQTEAQALSSFIRDDSFHAPFSLVLDCHSGFGLHDRIWFPYAKSKFQPIQHIGEVFHLRDLLFQAYPYHTYKFEPQAKHYLCHGDLWDYLYEESLQHNTVFLPLTLEMGSWRWVKKNPLQLLKSVGLFHPVKPHRVKRVLRSHLVLMEFLIRAVASYPNWLEDGKSLNMDQKATQLWYDN